MLKSRDHIQSLERAATILGAFSRNVPELSISELAERVGLARTTVHRIGVSLAHVGFLKYNPITGKYRLGYKLLTLGTTVLHQETVRQDARPYLLKVFEETQETVFLAVQDGHQVVYIDRLQPERALHIGQPFGGRSPLHCSCTGKALLMAMDPAERNSLLRNYQWTRMTQNTLTSLGVLDASLVEAQRRGFVCDHEESEVGICAVGAPISGPNGHVLAAFSVAAPQARVSGRWFHDMGRKVREVAQAITAAMQQPSGAASL